MTDHNTEAIETDLSQEIEGRDVLLRLSDGSRSEFMLAQCALQLFCGPDHTDARALKTADGWSVAVCVGVGLSPDNIEDFYVCESPTQFIITNKRRMKK